MRRRYDRKLFKPQPSPFVLRIYNKRGEVVFAYDLTNDVEITETKL